MAILAWLKSKLTNSWMNDMDYGWFMAHSGWSAFPLYIFATFTNFNLRVLSYATVGLLVAAGLKEYGYDANFELPAQTFKDNTQDFLGYCAGSALAWAVVYAHLHFVP